MIKNIINKLIKDGKSLPYFLYCLENIPEDVEDMCIFNNNELQFLDHLSKTEKNNLIKTYNKYAFKQFDMEIPEYIKKQLKENENKNYFQVNDDGSMLPWYCNISILQR